MSTTVAAAKRRRARAAQTVADFNARFPVGVRVRFLDRHTRTLCEAYVDDFLEARPVIQVGDDDGREVVPLVDIDVLEEPAADVVGIRLRKHDWHYVLRALESYAEMSWLPVEDVAATHRVRDEVYFQWVHSSHPKEKPR